MPRVARSWKLAAAAASVALLAMCDAAGAAAGGPFEILAGSWSGSGNVRLEGGRTEGLRCKAVYSPRGGGNATGLALRCASASNKIDLRASLNSRGNRVTGSWEERTFSVSGNASGQTAGNTIRLAIDAGMLSGWMSVVTNGRSQTISVRTDGAALRGVHISLHRD